MLPAGVPADERIVVIARGRKFSNGDYHRAEIDREGRFRVALEKRTRTGWLAIDARYAFLEESVKAPKDASSSVVLEPKLGARVVGRCRLAPALAARAASLRGVRVMLTTRGGTVESFERVATLDRDLAFEMGGLLAGRDLELALPADLGFDASSRVPALAPGETRTIELEVRPGATLRGIVVSEDGKPLPGVVILALRGGGDASTPSDDAPIVYRKSDSDGAFEFVGMRAGRWELEASAPNRLPAKLRLESVSDGETRADLRIVVPSGRAIRGRATWPDGSPVVGARVQWRALEAQDLQELFSSTRAAIANPREAIVTGDDGSFSIDALEDGTYRVQVSAARGSPEVDAARELSAPSEPAVWHAIADGVTPDSGELALVMKRSAALRGRVLDDAGNPVTRFSVHTFHALDPTGREFGRPGPESSFSDPEGRFVFEELWDGEWDVCVRSEHAAQAMPLRVVLPAQEMPLDVRLLRFATLSGVVVDPDGRAVPQARLEVELDRSSSSSCPFDSDTSHEARADGGFDVVVPAGWIDIRASGQGWAGSRSVRVIAGPGERIGGLEIALCRGGRIAGRVLDAHGRDAADCELRIMGDRGVVIVKSDASGRFESPALAPDDYTVLAYRRERGEAKGIAESREVEVRDGETIEVVFGAPKVARIRVRGVVRSGGVPVPDIGVEASRLADNPSFEGVRARTESDGRFELSLERGGWHIWTLNTQSTDTLRRVFVPNQPTFDLDFSISSGGVSGRVIGTDGAPLAGVSVRVEPDRDSVDRTPAHTTGSMTTGADGAFAFDHLEPATYRVQAGRASRSRAAEHGQATREGIAVRENGREHVELRLSKSCVLTGAIRYEDGDAGAGIEVFARDENGALIDSDALVVTDPAGAFRVVGLGAGNVTVFARGVGYASRESAAVTLEPARPARVEIVLERATRLYVGVKDAKGNAVSRVQVRVYDEQGRDCTVDVDDASPDDELDGFLEATLPAGTYRVVARRHDGSSASGTVVLTAGQPAASVSLTLSR